MRAGILLVALASVATVACEAESQFIVGKTPFVIVEVQTPRDGRAAITARAESFAARHDMRLHPAPVGLPEQPFNLALLRHDLNITSGALGAGDRTLTTAVSQGEPTERQRQHVKAYLCDVLRHGCR